MVDEAKIVAAVNNMEIESSEAKAEEEKVKGNELLKANKFASAVKHYTNAVQLNPNAEAAAVYLTNRAICHLKLEDYGLALEDTTAALKLNPKYSKALYRRGDAYAALRKYKLALADYK